MVVTVRAYIYNLDADGYTSAGIDATGVINMTDVDLGDASLDLYPAGSASSSVASASEITQSLTILTLEI